MKRNIMKVFIMVISIITILSGLCYADEIDPMFPYDRPMGPKHAVQQPETINVGTIIVIGIVIVAIVVVAIIVLANSKKRKDKEEKNER